jgi:hypothetical protein
VGERESHGRSGSCFAMEWGRKKTILIECSHASSALPSDESGVEVKELGHVDSEF